MSLRVAFFNAADLDQAFFRQHLSGHELVMVEGDLTPETAAQAAGADVISVRVSSRVTAEVMAGIPKLRHIACRTTGFDNVDLTYAAAHGITVSTVPAYGENTIAEYAFMLMLAVARHLLPASGVARHGLTDNDPHLTGFDLGGKTLGVIGAGRIGRHAARIGRGFDMKVLAYDVYPNEAAAKEIGYTYASLDEILKSADYLTLHAPATPETHHLMNAQAFAQLKPGVIMVNTGRGSLVDTQALLDALKDGRLAGAGLDVVEGEEYLKLSPAQRRQHPNALLDELMAQPNVVLTAHNGANSADAQARIRQTVVANLTAWEAGHPQNLITP